MHWVIAKYISVLKSIGFCLEIFNTFPVTFLSFRVIHITAPIRNFLNWWEVNRIADGNPMKGRHFLKWLPFLLEEK